MTDLANITIKLLRNEISEEAFLEAIGVNRSHIDRYSSDLIADAIATKNADQLSNAEFIRSKFHLLDAPHGYASKLDYWHSLLMHDWHSEHEQVISGLQMIADPSSIPFIRAAIELKPSLAYLDYDDYGSFYKKCFWALQAIGTDEAIATIASYATSSDAALAEQAQHRLNRISA